MQSIPEFLLTYFTSPCKTIFYIQYFINFIAIHRFLVIRSYLEMMVKCIGDFFLSTLVILQKLSKTHIFVFKFRLNFFIMTKISHIGNTWCSREWTQIPEVHGNLLTSPKYLINLFKLSLNPLHMIKNFPWF